MQREIEAILKAYLDDLRIEADTVSEILRIMDNRRGTHQQFLQELSSAVSKASNSMGATADYTQANTNANTNQGYGVEHFRSELDEAIANLEHMHRQRAVAPN